MPWLPASRGAAAAAAAAAEPAEAAAATSAAAEPAEAAAEAAAARRRTDRRRCSSRSTGRRPSAAGAAAIAGSTMKMMNRMNRNDSDRDREVAWRGAWLGAATSRGTSCSCTPRPSAMRLMMRVVAGEQPAAVLALRGTAAGSLRGSSGRRSRR